MKKIFLSVLFFLLCFCLFSCGQKDGYTQKTFWSMDTYITLKLSVTDKEGKKLPAKTLTDIALQCEAICKQIENACSRTIATSDTARLNTSEKGITAESEDFLQILNVALQIAEETGGAYSPTVGTLTELWNVTGGGYIPTAEELSQALDHIDYKTLTVNGTTVTKTDPAVILDLGGIAKGYAAQKIIDYLQTTPVQCGLVSMGGMIGVFGTKADSLPFRIAVANPTEESEPQWFDITEGFVAVSGDYERYFEVDGVRYHHIFDPVTGRPADRPYHSVAVWTTDGTRADAFSTAFFVMGEQSAGAFAEKYSIPIEIQIN